MLNFLKTLLTIIFLLALENFSLGQNDCDNYSLTPFPKCSCDDCGLIEPNWELLNGSSDVCEGEVFQVSGAQSAPLNLIEDFHWYFMDATTGEILYDILLTDTSYVSYSYIVTSDVSCNQSTVSLDIDLVTTSPTCPDGESCRFKLSGVNVRLRPRAFFEVEQEICITDAVQFTNTTCNNGETYLWDFGDNQTSTMENPSHTYNAPGTYTVTLIAYNDCGASMPFSQDVTIIGLPEAAVNYSLNPLSGCLPLTVDFNNNSLNIDSFNIQDFEWTISPNGGWYYNPDTIYSENSWNNVITFNQEGEYEVSLEVSNICGETTWTEIITVYKAPSVFLQDMGSYCETATIDFEDFVTYDGSITSYEWVITAPNGSITTYTSPTPSGTFNTPGLYNVDLLVDSDFCGAVSDDATFFIESSGAPDFSNIPTEVCSSDSIFQLIVQPPGGTWTSIPPTLALSSDGFFDPSLAVPGATYVLTYNPPGGCSDSGSLDLTVLAAANVSVETGTTLCIDNGPYTLQFSPTGGTWSSNSGSVSPDGVFDPQIAGVGRDTLKYTYVDGINCTVVELAEMIVEGLPVLTIAPSVTFCETNDPISLPNQLTITTDPNTGTFTWSGPGIVDAALGSFNSEQAGIGMHTIYVNYQLQDCEITDSVQITVTELTTATAGPDTAICINEGTFQLIGNPAGSGTWMEIGGSGTGLDSNTGLVDLSMAGEGEHTYAYVLASGTTCESSAQTALEIIDLSNNINAGADQEKCADDPPFTLQGFSPSGGTWSGTGITDPIAGVFDPGLVTPGTTVPLTYTIEDQNVDCPASDFISITVHELPVANFQIIGTTCINEVLEIENLSTNGCTYQWDFDDGSPIQTTPTPDHQYQLAGTYTISLTVTSCEDCIDVFTEQITVTEKAVPLFSTDVTEGCAELEVTFENLSTGTNMSYLWDFGNGQTSTLEEPGTIAFVQANADTTYTVVLAVTNECGTVYFEKDITVFPRPIVNFSPNEDDGCSPLSLDFSNITLGNPINFYWYIDGVLISTDSLLPDQEFTTTDSTITVYEIMLIADNNCGVDTLIKEVTVYPPNVEAFIFADTTKGCQPLTVNFENYSTPGATVTWDFGDGNGSNQFNPIHTYDTAGIFTIFQYASNCGTDTDSVIIEVLPVPDVLFTHQPYVCLGQPISFTNDSNNTNGSIWSFGDGDSSLIFSPEHVFDSVGTFTISLTGFSALNNCPATYTSMLDVYGPPDIGFSPSETEGCAPFTVQFTNNSVGPTSYYWDFGDGNLSNEENPTHTFVNPGIYVVTLTGTDTFGCFADSSVLNIIVHEIPTSQFSTNSNVYCSGIDLIETTNLSVGAVDYDWDFGGVFTSGQTEPSYLPLDTGALTIQLIAANQFMCRDTFTKTVQVLPSPQAIIPPGDFMGCHPFNISFGNGSQFATQYIWDFGDGNTSTDFAPAHDYLVDNSYAVQLIAENLNGCPADTATVQVTVFPVPVAQFAIDQELICGLPKTVAVNNQTIGAQDFDWQFGNGQSSDLFEPSIVYTSPGDFNIQLIAANQFGCRDTFSLPVSANLQSIAAIDPLYYEGCEPDTILFSDLSQNATTWLWDFGDGTFSTEQNPVHVYPETGNYEITLITSYNEVCFDTLETPGQVAIYPSPVANFSWMDLMDGLINFSNLSDGAVRYEWGFGNGDFTNQVSPSYEYHENGIWNVTLTAFHANGCPAVREVVVTPAIFYGLYFPNAMSPESGIGDVKVFKPTGIGIKKYNVKVFSPWGQLVWFSDLLDGEQPAEVWDGTFEGEIVPQGAYVWKAEVDYINGLTKVMTGTVLVIR